jgi:hypothetical protein
MARMLGPRTVIVAMCVVIAAGCGNEKRAAAPAATDTPEPTATPTRKPKAAPRRAHSVRTCAQLWNADALDPNNYQVSANEFVAELAPIRVHVAYQHEDCFVVMPIGNHRIAISTAAKGADRSATRTAAASSAASASRTTHAPIARGGCSSTRSR